MIVFNNLLTKAWGGDVVTHKDIFYIKQSKIFIKSLKLQALPDFPTVLSIKLQIIITAPCFWELGGQSYFIAIKIEKTIELN